MTKTIQRSIEIDCGPDRVWAVLTEFPAHPDWNPFIREITGEVAVGSHLRVRITPPEARAMTFKPVVTAATPGQQFAWLGSLGMRGIFDGAHSFVLHDLGGGRTRFTQSETFTGLLVPLFGRGLSATAEGFDQMNRALKARCETGASSTDADVPDPHGS